jgi:hydrogenase maturation protease
VHILLLPLPEAPYRAGIKRRVELNLECDTPVLVVGVGNPYRGDDAVGLFIARQIRDLAPRNVEVHENFGEVSGLIELFGNAEAVIIVDAVSSGCKPGEVFRFDAVSGKIPVDYFRFSTHAFGIAEAVELARTLGLLPPKVIVYGIEGKTFSIGEGLSAEIERAAQKVVELITQDIQDIREPDHNW